MDNLSKRVAVVTGANKGIGLATVKELCKRGVGTVYLTSRNITRGKEAVQEVKKEGYTPLFHQLDITDPISVRSFASYLKVTHGGFDILINNAAAITNEFMRTTYEDAKRVINTNYRSAFIIQEYLFPVLKDNGRVVNISSDCGHISNITNSTWVKRLTKEDIKVDDVNAFVDWFLESIKNGTLNHEDFKENAVLAYRVSKVALCALTRVQQKQIGRGISINSLHPGFVHTDMTKTVVPEHLLSLFQQNPKVMEHFGRIPIEKSGEAPVYVALDLDQSVKGRYFWYDKTEKDWTDSTLELFAKVQDFRQLLKNTGVTLTL